MLNAKTFVIQGLKGMLETWTKQRDEYIANNLIKEAYVVEKNIQRLQVYLTYLEKTVSDE